ncbi:hypothetical protein [Clostridium perfringens]|uniref:hypothetical protein n=1 Tax=Clostridium perfringens TaxID=1502 RepID=UPI000F544C18|nr:hypothetical protein [Clostridium perfringens]BDC03424.1 hypothetical protein CP118TE_31330 [Clostridium perfringens E]
MNLKDIKTTKEVSLEYNIPIRTVHNRIESCNLLEGVDYRKLGERQPTLLSPSGVEKILKNNKKRLDL